MNTQAQNEHVQNQANASAQRVLRDRLAPVTPQRKAHVADVIATLDRWCSQADPVEVSTIVGAELGKRVPSVRSLKMSAVQAGHALFARAEGDVPSAGGEP